MEHIISCLDSSRPVVPCMMGEASGELAVRRNNRLCFSMDMPSGKKVKGMGRGEMCTRALTMFSALQVQNEIAELSSIGAVRCSGQIREIDL